MKRFFDFAVSLVAIIILSPLFLLIALIVLIDAGRPVIFKQARVGKNNELFYIYKFRTMANNTKNVATSELKNADEFITASGKLLRKTSLDELPQLFNILKGSMSFVGPRPLIPEEEHIRELRLKYNVYSVRPGMTGLAQINGRDILNDDEKARFDREYVEKHNIMFDLKIFIKTIFVVLTGKGVVEGSETKTKR